MKIRLAILLCCVAAAVIIILECCKTKTDTPVVTANAFVGNASCQSCHQQEHAEWTTSHHYMAMQPATDSFVLGNFNNVTFTADGVTSTFFRKDGKFFINTEGEDGRNHDYEVKYVFGFTPLQQYLIEFPGGRMQATRLSWDSRNKKWFNQYAGTKIPAGDWLHWTGNAQNWNTMCASCHSTNLKKGYDVGTDTYHTTYNDINVSCESCHGPGKQHIDYINGSDYKEGKRTAGSLLQLYKSSGQMAEVNTCGYCHARRSDISETVPVGAEVMQDYIPELPTTEYFYADGQMNDEDYNYTSFLQSKMFHRGVQCSNCHNSHSGKLKLSGPLVCGQCHQPEKYEASSHTLHAPNTNNVNCITCHMPSKVYMGNDLRHDHSFRVPRPDLTAKYGTPNTCNQCHTDKSPQWAAEKIAAGFGPQRPYHFSEDLIPASRLDAQSEAHLARLLKDTTVPGIVKAASLRYLGVLGSPNARGMLVQALGSGNALERYTALRSLRSFAPSAWVDAASPLLTDPVRGVRIAAADLMVELPTGQLPATAYDPFTRAKAELEQFIIFQTDFAQGNQQAGDYYRRLNDLQTAEKYYRRAIAKDSLLVAARINLASTLNATGKNDEALRQLQVAARIQPANDHVHYTLGLLYAEMQRLPEAAQSLRKTITLNPANLRAQYNYGLLMQQMGKPAEAEKTYLTALQQDPRNPEVLNALTILYLQQGQAEKALAAGRQLQQYHGNNPAYVQLLRQLRLQ
jgi:tetratricopeptide (TPR) repeat protein